MRARNIKPGFFKNEILAEMPTETRLLFIGLWLMADREGRLEDRPKKIKIELFPYDQFDIDSMLNELQANEFILRYTHSGRGYIQVENFVKHQDPHYREKASEIPAPSGYENKIIATGVTRTQRARILERDGFRCQSCWSEEHLCIDHILPVSRGGDSSDDNLQVLCLSCNTKKGNRLAGEEKYITKPNLSGFVPTSNQRRVDVELNQSQCAPLIPDSLIPDSLTPEPPITKRSAGGYPAEFEAAWRVYPKKTNKGAALKAWKQATKRGMPVDLLPQHIESRMFEPDWRKEDGRFVPHLSTWLNADGWLDEGASITPPADDDDAWLVTDFYENDAGIVVLPPEAKRGAI